MQYVLVKEMNCPDCQGNGHRRQGNNYASCPTCHERGRVPATTQFKAAHFAGVTNVKTAADVLVLYVAWITGIMAAVFMTVIVITAVVFLLTFLFSGGVGTFVHFLLSPKGT